jgi:hypothetical protein
MSESLEHTISYPNVVTSLSLPFKVHKFREIPRRALLSSIAVVSIVLRAEMSGSTAKRKMIQRVMRSLNDVEIPSEKQNRKNNT